MKNSNIPLAIILKRTQNGYQFESLQELLPNKDKNKKPKPGRKPAAKGVPNRLIKEIGLSNDQVVQNTLQTPEPQPPQQFEQEIHDNAPIYHQLQEEEEVSCQIDRQTQLPKSPANWFDKTKIHQIQKREMKEFFSGSENKKPELYVKYRNFMIEAYQKNPKRYLSKIACRKILRGDVNIIIRIHSFLEKEGLINFSLNYDGNFTFKSTSLTKPFEQTVQPQTTLKSLPEADQQTAQKQIDTDNMTLTVINKNFSRTYRACCNECKLICGILWFANVNEEESSVQKNLCYECWNKKPETEKQEYEKVDIVKKMQIHGRDGKNFPKNAWNIEQNIKLLEFMSANTEDKKSWRQLLNEFGGKRTIQDIVLQFLQFPISNVQIKKAKTNLEKYFPKNDKVQIGSSYQDHKNILKQFYEQSEYNKKRSRNLTKIDGVVQINGISHAKNEKKEECLALKQMLYLAMTKINVQVENLKSQEQLIQAKTANYSSAISYRRSKVLGPQDQEQAKQTNDLENRSKSLKNLGEKKNSSSQFLDDIEGDANDLSQL